MRRSRLAWLCLALTLPWLPASAGAADCGQDARVSQLVAAQGGEPLSGFAPPADRAEAACLRDALILALRRDAGFGRVVGYKVGLTSRVMQQRLGIDHPVWGILLAGMLLPDGARVPPDYATRPMVEADLLVTVADEGINQARTPAEVAAHLADLRPFIELASFGVAEGEPLSETTIVAINVGARLGVVGKAVPMTRTLAEALPGMTVTMTGPEGVLLQVPGAAILGDPLQAVVWLVQALKAEGRSLRTGDVISLGSFGPPQVPQAGATFAVTYGSLPGGDLKVRVTFTEK